VLIRVFIITVITLERSRSYGSILPGRTIGAETQRKGSRECHPDTYAKR